MTDDPKRDESEITLGCLFVVLVLWVMGSGVALTIKLNQIIELLEKMAR